MTRDTEALHPWLALHHVQGLGPRACLWLLDRFASPAAALAAGDEALATAGAATRLRRLLARGPDYRAVERDLDWLKQPDRHIVVLNDPCYPASLRAIPDPPLLLYVCGDPALLASPQLAVVGSRNPTPAGRETAYEFARALIACGLTITSGLAMGIDAAAHEGALDAGGNSIAVTGTGPDRVYPAGHRKLARRLCLQGALVTELAPGTPPRARHFPRRNRIISGLSLGVLVTEAALRSGSLITARLALEQGREVFAVPGSIHNPLARGCHALIRQGAKLVESLEDIVEEITTAQHAPPATQNLMETKPACTDLVQDGPDALTSRVLARLDFDPVPLDVLVRRTGLTAGQLSSILLALELENHITALPGGLYLRRTQRQSP